MTDTIPPVLRRSFIAAAVLFAVAAVLILFTLVRESPKDESGLGENFRYDLSALRKVDPALIIADEAGGYPAGVQHPTVMAQGPGDTVYIGGAGEIVLLGPEGKREAGLKISGAPTALTADPEGKRIFAAFGDRIEILDGAGKTTGGWRGLNSNSVFTALVLLEDSLFAADAGNRLVLKYGMDGTLQSKLGDKASEYAEGFVIPSPYFPLVAALDGSLWVVDPGRHRFINFTRDGRVRSRWQNAAMTIDGFCGCCNPTHFVVRDDGSFVTAEKGLVRVKIHAPDGTLTGVVAAPDKFGLDTRGLALLVDRTGRILVLDPEREAVRIFKLRNQDADAGNGRK